MKIEENELFTNSKMKMKERESERKSVSAWMV